MTKVLFAGEGGQGVQVIAEILAKAAFKEGKSSLYIPNFGVEQRGGTSLAFVVINQKPIAYPKFQQADFLAILSDRSIKRVEPYLGPKTKVILGPAVTQKQIPKAARVFHLEGETDRPPQVWNVMVLGEVNRQGKLVKITSLVETMKERFARQFKENPGLKELDLKAIKGKSDGF